MAVAMIVVAALAAALHVYIFVLESLLWTHPRTRASFGTSAQEAQATREMAFNQGSTTSSWRSSSSSAWPAGSPTMLSALH